MLPLPRKLSLLPSSPDKAAETQQALGLCCLLFLATKSLTPVGARVCEGWFHDAMSWLQMTPIPRPHGQKTRVQARLVLALYLCDLSSQKCEKKVWLLLLTPLFKKGKSCWQDKNTQTLFFVCSTWKSHPQRSRACRNHSPASEKHIPVSPFIALPSQIYYHLVTLNGLFWQVAKLFLVVVVVVDDAVVAAFVCFCNFLLLFFHFRFW